MIQKSKKNPLPKATKTKKLIINTFIDLISEKKWEDITVKELCIEASITRGTFYNYFSDIYDLIEQIETPLLEELTTTYKKLQVPIEPYSHNFFKEKYVFAPPASMRFWFYFCKKHKTKIKALIGPNGDQYFIIKLKNILKEQINFMMDADAMPHDDLRLHFTKAFLELHILVAQSWLSSSDEDFLSIDEIINVLNTMRVGGSYLSYLQQTNPDFKSMMEYNEWDDEM